jgi:hypothetical protein
MSGLAIRSVRASTTLECRRRVPHGDALVASVPSVISSRCTMPTPVLGVSTERNSGRRHFARADRVERGRGAEAPRPWRFRYRASVTSFLTPMLCGNGIRETAVPTATLFARFLFVAGSSTFFKVVCVGEMRWT